MHKNMLLAPPNVDQALQPGEHSLRPLNELLAIPKRGNVCAPVASQVTCRIGKIDVPKTNMCLDPMLDDVEPDPGRRRVGNSMKEFQPVRHA
jgi:hypothetical protein